MENVKRLSPYLYGLIPFLCIVFGLPGQVYPFGGTKAFFFVGIIGCIVAVLLYKNIRSKTPLSIAMIDIVFLIFLMGMTLTSIFGVDPSLSFFGSFDFGVSVMVWWATFIYYFTLKHLIVSRPAVKTALLWGIVLGGCITVCCVWLSHLMIVPGVFLGGLEGNSSLAGYVILCAIGVAILLMQQSKKLQKILLGVGTVFMVLNPLYVVFSTKAIEVGDARGVLLASAVAAIFAIGFAHVRNTTIRWRTLGKVILGVSFAVCVGIAISFMQPISTPKTMFIEHGGANRLLFWQSAIDATLERPLLGHGTATFEYSFFSHFDTRLYYSNTVFEGWTDKPHNAVIELAHDNGVLITLVYLVLIGYTYRRLYQLLLIPKRSSEAVIVFFLLTAYLLQNMLIFDGVTSVVLFGVLLALIWRDSPTKYTIHIPSYVRLFGMGGAVVVIYFFSVLLFVEGHRIYRAVRMPNGARGDALVEAFTTSHAGGIVSSGYIANRLVTNCTQSSVYDCTKDIAQLSVGIAAEPTSQISIPYHLFRANAALYLYAHTHQQNEIAIAQQEARRIVELSPSYPEGYWALGHAQYEAGDIQGALVSVLTVLNIDPNIKEAYKKMILVARLAKNGGLVTKTIQRAEERFPGFAQEVAQ